MITNHIKALRKGLREIQKNITYFKLGLDVIGAAESQGMPKPDKIETIKETLEYLIRLEGKHIELIKLLDEEEHYGRKKKSGTNRIFGK